MSYPRLVVAALVNTLRLDVGRRRDAHRPHVLTPVMTSAVSVVWLERHNRTVGPRHPEVAGSLPAVAPE